jgi:radical SAM superfamily enzyme YgiQ (UPF0313 family)
MKLLIISPSWLPEFWNGGKVLSPPMCLPVLAALTPPGAYMHLVDENVEPVNLAEDADLVAISAMTASAPRAYEIADAFRARGISVVMGGMHPSALPEEAALHADSVVVGEAENQWPQVYADFAAGHPQRLYRAAERPQLANLPFPRRDLLRADRYLTANLVQTARGCPHACSFCSVSPVFGRRYRFRPIPEVIAEIRSLNSRSIAFPDDNIVGNPARARELFEALIPLQVRWVGQGDLSMARDEDLLKLMARSGCLAMFVGIESLSADSLASAHKHPNVGLDLARAIATIHRHGIDLVGSFVFGLDGDTPSLFRETVAFTERVKLGAAQFSVLTPFPGTPVFDQLHSEGRILNYDWSLYTMGHVVFQPQNMTVAELLAGRNYAYNRFYSLPSIAKRLLVRRGSRLNFGLRLATNLSYRGRLRGGKIADSLAIDGSAVTVPVVVAKPQPETA